MSNVIDRTRTHIVTSFYELLKQKSFKSITIQNICDACKIHRSTFYRYYSDKYELMHDVLQVIANDFRKQINGKEDKFYELIVDYVIDTEMILEHILEEDELFNEVVSLVAKLITIASETKKRRIVLKRLDNLPDSTILIDFYSSGIVYVLKQWVTKNYDYSQEQLQQIIREMVNESL